MRLQINGQDKEVASIQSLEDLLRELEVEGKHIAVALNQQVVPRSRYPETALKEGDAVEIVHAVGGGA